MPLTTLHGPQARRLFRNIISDPDLVFLTPMNEASGAVLDRCTRNNLSGTVSGSPTYGVALANGFVGMSFTRATPDYVNFGSQAALNFGNNSPFTVLCVINPNVVAYGHICGERDDGNNLGAWGWAINPDYQSLVLFGTTSGLSYVGGAAIANGTSYMLGMTADGTGTVAGIKPYRNGVAEAPATIADTLLGAGNNQQPFTIGAHDTGGGTFGEALNANALGFVAVFNVVKSAADMLRWARLGGYA